SVALGEDAGVAPGLAGEWAGVLLRQRSDVEDVDHEQVARLGTFDRERPAEGVHDRQRRVPYVVGGVVVVDLAVEPLPAVGPERLTGPNGRHRWDVRVPPVVTDLLLVPELPIRVEREQHLWHGYVPSHVRWLKAGADGR